MRDLYAEPPVVASPLIDNDANACHGVERKGAYDSCTDSSFCLHCRSPKDASSTLPFQGRSAEFSDLTSHIELTSPEPPPRLEVRQGHQGNHVPGLTEHPVTCADEAWELLQSGSRSRSVGATNANEHSSRSHW